MKNIKLFTIIASLLFIMSACATVSPEKAGKYDLADQLEPVSEILRYNLMGWEAVDSQSFILQTAPSQYYLIVLISPSDRLRFTEDISITHTGAMVKPGYDKVTVYGSPYSDTFVIQKIFKLKDREEADAIKEQLSGKS
jgi:hypothetical protein